MFQAEYPGGDAGDLLRAVAEVADALSQERGEVVALLAALVQAQRQTAERIDELIAGVDALRASSDGDGLADGAAALRWEAGQAKQQTRRLIEQSRTLVARAAASADGASPAEASRER